MALQIDSGNVAAVLYENRYYLAYIQDIRDTDALVDFHCEMLPPTWISLEFIWPQMFIREFPQLDPDSTEIQVAVRDDPKGPLLFRPGRLILEPNRGMYKVLYVEWINSTGMTCRTVVRQTQIIDGVPLPERSLLSLVGDGAAKPFLKLVLPLEMSCLPTAMSNDLFQLRQLIEHFLFTKAYTTPCYAGCYHNNFHLTLAMDSMLFIFWERSVVIQHKQWTNDDIVNVVATWISQLPVASTGSNGQKQCDDLSSSDTLPDLAQLPDVILYQILTDLEIHDLIIAFKVCRRWRTVLANLSQLPHIKIDLHKRRQMFVAREYIWDMGVLLDKLLHARVKTLTLLNTGTTHGTFYAALTPVKALGALRGVRFRAIALIDGVSSGQISTGKWGKLCRQWGALTPFTDLLIVRNVKIRRLLTPNYAPVSEGPDVDLLLEGVAISRAKRPLPGLTIPDIRFDFRQPEMNNFRILLECMERCCPDASDEERAAALDVYHRHLMSPQLPEHLLEIRDIAQQWKSIDPAGRFGGLCDAEVSSRELASTYTSKLFPYAVLSMLKIFGYF